MIHGLARWLSIILHPFIVAVVTVIVVLNASGRGLKASLPWLGVVLLTTVVPLLTRISLRYWHVGSDFDIFHRHQRDTVYVLAALCVLALVIIVTIYPAPVLLRGTVYAVLPALVAAGAINRVTKISVHAMVMAGCGVVWGVLHPLAWWLVIPLITLLGWSRVYLGRHTVGQVALGWLVATVSVLLVLPRYLEPVGPT